MLVTIQSYLTHLCNLDNIVCMQDQSLDQQIVPKDTSAAIVQQLAARDSQYIQVYRNMLLEEQLCRVTYQYLSITAHAYRYIGSFTMVLIKT